MNKRGFIFILFIFLLFAGVAAIVLEDLEDRFGIANDVKDEIEDSPTDYLKQEWGKIIEKTALGKFMNETQWTLELLNPFFNIVLGMSFSWSFLFILNLILWIFLATIIYRTFSIFMFFQNQLRLIMSLIIIIIISAIGLTAKISEFIINQIIKLDSLGMQIISVFVLIMLLLFASMYSKKLEEIFSETTEKINNKKTAKLAKKAVKKATRNRTILVKTAEEIEARKAKEALERKARTELEGTSSTN